MHGNVLQHHDIEGLGWKWKVESARMREPNVFLEANELCEPHRSLIERLA
jgi:hypothetical protein